MALSFGANIGKLNIDKLPINMGYDAGDTRAIKGLYDDGILRASRTVPGGSAGRPSATRATNKTTQNRLTFGSSVPKVAAVTPSRSLSFPASVKPVQTRSSPGFNVGNFLSTLSMGVSTRDTRSRRDIYDDGALRAARSAPAPRPVKAIPEVHTATIDGGASTISKIKDAAGLIGGLLGGGDAPREEVEIIPASFGGRGGGPDNTMLLVGGLAVAAGVAYLAFGK